MKHARVPAAAVYAPDLEEWELGKRDSKGKRTGAFKFWWPATGHLSGKSLFEDGGKKETLERYHPDGTISHKGITVNGTPMPGTTYVLQRSKNKTTELAIVAEPTYRAVFRMEQIVVSKKLSKWRNFDAKGRRIDLDGNLLHTVDVKKYAANFKPFALPRLLAKLVEFQNDVGAEDFAEGFVVEPDDKGLIKNFCDHNGKPFGHAKKFLAALLPIAAATGTGSWYFAWANGAKRVEQMPIVIFGDEGGYHVVAKNLGELLQIVASDVEPSVAHDVVTFYKEKGEAPSSEIAAYRAWLGVKVAKPAVIVKEAQAKYEAAFQAWVKSFSAS